MTQPEAFTAAQASDPLTPGQVLADIAALRPDLRVAVAGNPSAYPGLLEWLGSLGDPAVDAAIAARTPVEQATQQFPVQPPTPEWAAQPPQGPGYALPPQGPPQGLPPQGPGYAPLGTPPTSSGNKVLWIVLGVVGGLILLSVIGVLVFINFIRDKADDAADELSEIADIDDLDDLDLDDLTDITTGGNTYGDDAALDALWDACADEDWQACDDLYMDSPFGSRYEEFGDTCGDRTDGSTWCTSEFGAAATASSYGDDAYLDNLWDACTGEDWQACDDLYWGSGVGTAYETYGSSCGNRTGSTYGGCVTEYGGATSSGAFTYGDDAYLDGLWDACAGGDWQACDDLYWNSAIDSEYEEFGDTCGGRQAVGTNEYCVDSQG